MQGNKFPENIHLPDLGLNPNKTSTGLLHNKHVIWSRSEYVAFTHNF